ncbi:hypothetical protein UFOVP634_48 [uncultured Caudovirales phage]|uniref:Uncharacterized protein n=1 Tax=uncultured Caudovirales phage TaxID=2100421 RepID=A0A6J5N5G0_9CAUD|nr:hypothetical protein UFOVP634_48 [uncultured Caudovirales phage]
MTPKEKAKELFDKYVELSGIFVGDYDSEKEMCLIAVNELIYETQFEVPNIRQRYWIDVKQEIEKL